MPEEGVGRDLPSDLAFRTSLGERSELGGRKVSISRVHTKRKGALTQKGRKSQNDKAPEDTGHDRANHSQHPPPLAEKKALAFVL